MTTIAPVNLVAILGMHRSGTSCLAGSLEQRGLHLDRVFEWSPHNLKGNRENAEVMTLNEAVLEASGGSWDRPPASLVWGAEHADSREAIIERCTRGFTTSWGFKDPRSIFTLPFWQAASKPMRLVGTFRHPLLAARSLETRNGMPIPDGLRLWAQYNTRLLAHFRDHSFPIVSFDDGDADYLISIDRIADYLGLPKPSAPAAERFLDDGLRHLDPGDTDHLPPDVAELYERLVDASETFRRSRP